MSMVVKPITAVERLHGMQEVSGSNIPYGTTLAALKTAITQATNATFEIYEADGTTVATVLASGKKVIVTAQDGLTKVTYTVSVNAAPSNGGSGDGSATPIVPIPTVVPTPTPLKASGIIYGYLDGTFKPNQTISRAEIVAMLSKVINTTFVKSAKFNDVAGHWAEAEIDTLSDMGIVKGAADGSFKPNASATRFESLLMVLRMLNISLGLSLDIE
ncbi:hypothetical protein Back11_02550 [Paenibacillus baekrokdamisoli]|uniref:Uncharacterized protein n=1 Tax=Paenibacillus baekrokdamisoli TaxID=1712516 RepID=A0A3G9IJ26_9BACL|nr:S-layer homology domain-containing protein [Paenibacillus baekrokdamisoli]MBB3069113.1 hypothetical protein [Paenibacillus baekrokdamisoli]BBH18910.1 hypothetical protein Back11_02550 [Paenibacillus baekrokdamisoli]